MGAVGHGAIWNGTLDNLEWVWDNFEWVGGKKDRLY